MKKSAGPDPLPLNSPAAMFARAVYLALVALSAAVIALAFVGAVTRDLRCGVAAIAAAVLAWLARDWLRHGDKLAAVSRCLEEWDHGETPAGSLFEDEPMGRLVSLLRDWDAAERQRGQPGFDPWELQSLRREIQSEIEHDPALSRLFHA